MILDLFSMTMPTLGLLSVPSRQGDARAMKSSEVSSTFKNIIKSAVVGVS